MMQHECRWDTSGAEAPIVQLWMQHVDQLGRPSLYPCVGRLQIANAGSLHVRATNVPPTAFGAASSVIVIIDCAEATIMLVARAAKTDPATPRDVTLSIVADRERRDGLLPYWTWLAAQDGEHGLVGVEVGV
jgi:hypothetical protein